MECSLTRLSWRARKLAREELDLAGIVLRVRGDRFVTHLDVVVVLEIERELHQGVGGPRSASAGARAVVSGGRPVCLSLLDVPHNGVLGRPSALICPIPARASRSSSAGRP